MSKPPAKLTGIYEVTDALIAIIQSADSERREALANNLAMYEKNFPADFAFAISQSAPLMLMELFQSILIASDPNFRLRDKEERGNVIRLARPTSTANE
jgi:hypothetical protein